MIDARTQAIAWRFALGLLLTEIPIVTELLGNPNADWRLVAAGLLGGLGGALTKYWEPQITTASGLGYIGVPLSKTGPVPTLHQAAKRQKAEHHAAHKVNV